MAEDLFRPAAVGRVFQRAIEGVDLAHQRLAPSSDRRNVVELWRAKAELDIPRHMRAIEQGGSRR